MKKAGRARKNMEFWRPYFRQNRGEKQIEKDKREEKHVYRLHF